MSKLDQSEERAAFNDAYASLNAAQKKAVDTIEGPVMVIAGPGTGKTQILTLRIANILLQTDTKPGNILALTFTEAGAAAMRNRLRQFIGSAAYQVPIYTFHGFASRLIAEYPDSYTTIIGGKPLSDLERVTTFEQILNDSTFASIRPAGNPTFYLRPLSSAIQTLKREAVSPDDLAAYNEVLAQQLADTEQYHLKGAHKGKVRGEYSDLEKKVKKNDELLLVYRQYQSILKSERWFDYEDMLIETIAALESDESMLRDIQETCQYVLADEHQDVNGSQNRLLELLSSYHDSPNIFVVGDEKQAIYRFQGASLENFLYFEDQFKGATTISLTDNYRSAQSILDVAHELIAAPEDEALAKLRVPLSAALQKDSSLSIRQFAHQAVEESWLVDEVKGWLEKGVSPAEVAVIVRRNADVEAVARLLRDADIKVTASAESDILTHPITTAVRALLRTLTHPQDEEALFRVLHAPYSGIALPELASTLSKRRHDQSLWSLFGQWPIVSTLESVREEIGSEAPHRVVAALIEQTGFKKHYLERSPLEAGRVLRRLLDEIEAMVRQEPSSTVADVSDRFTALLEHHLPLNAPYIGSAQESVQVMTAHKSKGLEFAVVIAPFLTDAAWGGRSSPQYFSLPLTKHSVPDALDTLDDERRLLYVLLTRAKEHLALSYSNTNSDGKEFLPSRLLEGVEGYFTKESTAALEESFDPTPDFSLTPEASLASELLTELFAARGFSATSLNNFLESPYSYLYRNIFRLPEVQALPMLFGTAVHDVLESVTRKGEAPSVSELAQMLHGALSKLPLSTTEQTILHERALSALTVYLEHYFISPANTTKEELSIKVELPVDLPDCPTIPLSGKLDRIDIGEDGLALRVVDYKTGSPKTRNVIEGKTKTSNGNYKRQLTFYALLLELYGDERYHTKTGTLSFVEPDKHGVIHEETFTITDEEIAELKETIVDCARSFITGSFLDTPCDANVCEYCPLVTELLARQTKGE